MIWSPKTTCVVMAGALLLGWSSPAEARAANKEQQLLMAELRMLQEEQQKLQQLLGGLSEALTKINTRLDADANRQQKLFADQKVVLDGVAEASRILREKADDTNVRLSTMTQELQSLRQTVASMPPPLSGTPAAPGDPGAVADPDAPGTAPVPVTPANISPTQMWDKVYAIYTAGQWDLAVDGFGAYMRTFPTSPQADDAQLYIGQSLYNAGRYDEAIAALQKVVSGYPQSDSVAAAHYKMGLTYEATKQFDQARRSFDTVVKGHPNSQEGILAQQALERIKTRKDN